MEELKVQGKVIQLSQIQQGETKKGDPWKKQEFIIETPGDYPKKICIGNFNDKIKTPEVGQLVNVSINITSREYNEKWYSNIDAWKIEVIGGPQEQPQEGNFPPEESSPF